MGGDVPENVHEPMEHGVLSRKFIFDSGLQQLPSSFGQQLFQIAFGFGFCSLSERDHTNFHSRCILSFRLLG
jgi:hypothetical protein